MTSQQVGLKLQQLENFLTKPDSEESKNYIADLLTGGTARPEYLFVQKFLSVDFWKELGFSDNEIKIESPAGAGGRVEITLVVEGEKIAIECKRPYELKNDQVTINELNGNDINELKDQIGPYLLSHSFIVFTNGFHWYFYSRESYRAWTIANKRKDVSLKPYFEHFTSDVILDKTSTHHILNLLKRENVITTLSGIEYESIRHVLTDEFFEDLKTWITVIDLSLRKAPINLKARTTSLINKLIFVRTMEDVGIIPNGFLSTLWNNKKGVKNSSVDFVDHIDDELSEIYDTELFTSKYVVNEDGQPLLKNGYPEFSEERKKNYAYSSLSEDFFSAALRPIEPTNLNDTGIYKMTIEGKDYFIRSLYWWRFESIPADILGKAYETYLARERKKLGIYYTPHQITEYLTRRTVNTVFDSKISELKDEFLKERWDIEKIKQISNKIRNIKICDPSCGSGSFLIQAVRIVWKKYRELEMLIRASDRQLDGKGSLDDHFTDKATAIRLLEDIFRIKDERERMGTLILRHIFGNDKDEKAADTAKLNIWLECIRLDPNSYRKDKLKGKRHVLPNLILNITTGDSLIGLDVEETHNVLSRYKGSVKSIFGLKRLYTESFVKTSIAHDAAKIKNGLRGFVDEKFVEKYDKAGKELIKTLQVTHWPLQHVDAYYDENEELKPEDERGFDVIIGNPPWEILEPNINEFYGPLYNADDLTRFSLLTKNEKNKIIGELSKEKTIQTKWEQYNREIDIQQEFYIKSKIYKHQAAETDAPQNKIRMNLYKLFLEKYFMLLKKDGIAGIVIPANLYTDLGSKGLRQLLFDANQILSLFSFENRKGIFEEIHRQFKFITLVFKKGGKTTHFRSAFYISNVNQIFTLENTSMLYDIDIVRRASPDSLTILESKNQMEVDIVNKMLKFPLLAEPSRWRIRFQREFNMTDDAHLFNTEGGGGIIYEGKMIHQFTHQFAGSRYWVEIEKGRKVLESLQMKRMKKESKNTKKQPKDSEVLIDFDFYRLGWRDVTNATNQRTLISTILPPGVFLSYTIPYLRPNYYDGEKFEKAISSKGIAFLCGLFNSFVVDFLIRQRVSIHATMSHVLELPIPRPEENDELFLKISNLVGCLICTTPEFDQLGAELNVKKAITDPMERENIVARINAYVAKIYNLPKNELEYILSTFPLVGDKIKQHVLEEFTKIEN